MEKAQNNSHNLAKLHRDANLFKARSKDQIKKITQRPKSSFRY